MAAPCSQWIACSPVREGSGGRPLNSVVRQHLSAVESNYAAEFQARRRTAWRLAWPWLTVGVLGASVTIFFGASESAPWQERAPTILLSIGFFALVGRAAYIANKYYRCPGCENVVFAADGIAINPSQCPTCGGRLK